MNTQQTNASRHADSFRLGRLFRWLASIFLTLLLAAFAPQAEAVEATNTGGLVTYHTDEGGTNWIYHVFTNAGASGMKFHTRAAGGTVELLVVAGGGSGGGSIYNGGAGGAGGLIYTNHTVTHNTDYAITVGRGGNAVGVNLGVVGNTGQNSSFGSSLTAYGGGGGGYYNFGGGGVQGQTGGSGGGGAGNNALAGGTNGGIATVLSPMQGNNGGGVDVTGMRDGAISTGGGGAARWFGGNGGNGGSGVVILRYDMTPPGTVYIVH